MSHDRQEDKRIESFGEESEGADEAGMESCSDDAEKRGVADRQAGRRVGRKEGRGRKEREERVGEEGRRRGAYDCGMQMGASSSSTSRFHRSVSNASTSENLTRRL